MTTWKSRDIGGRAHVFLVVVIDNSEVAVRDSSCPPCILAIFQINELSLPLYLHFPPDTEIFAFVVLVGVGILTRIL